MVCVSIDFQAHVCIYFQAFRLKVDKQKVVLISSMHPVVDGWLLEGSQLPLAHLVGVIVVDSPPLALLGLGLTGNGRSSRPEEF